MLKKWIDPGSGDMPRQGFEPGLVIRGYRLFSRGLIRLLGINGRTRWSNEFIQTLDPHVVIDVADVFPNSKFNDATLWFRTGHGRLYWRCRQTINEEPETNTWISGFCSDDVFFDIGANVGVYALMAAKLFGVRTVAVEPDLMNARMLYENLIANRVSDNVTVLPVALSERNYNGTFFLKTLGYGDALHNLDERNPMATSRAELGSTVSVAIFSLDTLVAILGLPKPTKLKIDVDGAEFRILLGAEECLKSVSSLLIELDGKSEKTEAITQFLSERGFYKRFQAEKKAYHGCTNAIFERL